jgi:3-deoxy-D-manno-octulosonate 8-phosphate phosphatase (KDO 8-P phosphatase)
MLGQWENAVMTELSPELIEKLKRIRLLALDSDGVLTDGGVYIADDGRQFRRFDIKDGAGLKQVMALGIQVVIISSSKNQAVIHRGQELGIGDVYTGITDKLSCLRNICDHYGVLLDQVCCIGDDIVDLAVMPFVGLSCAPDNSVTDVLKKVDFVIPKHGGFGAVRLMCDLICHIKIEEEERNFL